MQFEVSTDKEESLSEFGNFFGSRIHNTAVDAFIDGIGVAMRRNHSYISFNARVFIRINVTHKDKYKMACHILFHRYNAYYHDTPSDEWNEMNMILGNLNDERDHG